MWVADELLQRATLEQREEEVRQARLVAEARRPVGGDAEQRVWRWRVEPGMQEAFQELLGWFLSSQKQAEIETSGPPNAAAPEVHRREQQASIAAREQPVRRPLAGLRSWFAWQILKLACRLDGRACRRAIARYQASWVGT